MGGRGRRGVEADPGASALFTAFNSNLVAIGAGGLAFSKAIGLAADSVRAIASSEVEFAKLDAALANSGKLTDDYREMLDRLAQSRSQKPSVDNEKYLGVFTTPRGLFFSSPIEGRKWFADRPWRE